jgi:hypothetical protein
MDLNNMNQELDIIFTENFLNAFTGTQEDLDEIIRQVYEDFPDAYGKFVIGTQDEDYESLEDILDDDDDYDAIPKHKLN